MGFLDNYVNNLTDSNMGPYSLTDEDRKKLKKRGLLNFGLTMLSTPTGNGGLAQAFGKGLLGGANAVQNGSQDMMQQKFQADQMARKKAEMDKQALIDGLAQKHRKPDGTIDMDGLRNDYMSIDPTKFITDTQGVQSSFQGADGNMYVIGRDGTAKNLGVKFNPSLQYKTDSNNNPYAFDKTTGSIAPVGGAPAQAPQIGGKQPSIMELAPMMPMFGGQISSTYRTPTHNTEVGGKPNSQHMDGTAMDVVFPNAQGKAMAIAAAKKNGFMAIEEGDHVHFQLAHRGAPSGFAARTPEDIAGAKAAAEAQAKAGVELATVGDIEAAKTIGGETGKANAAKVINAPKVISDADSLEGLLDKAINHPGREAATGTSSLNPLNAWPGSDAKNFSVLAGQIKGKTFLEAFNSLRGAGAITEKEGSAATAAIARLDMAQSEEAYLEALNELKSIVSQAKQRALTPIGGSQAMDAPSRAPAQKSMMTFEQRAAKYRKP